MKIKNILCGIIVTAIALLSFTACSSTDYVTPELKVTPDKDIFFEASGNKAVSLKVTTNQDEWTIDKTPEWLKAKKISDTEIELTVNDNETGEERLGRLIVKAGKALPVKISIVQKAKKEGGEVETPEGAAQFVANSTKIFVNDKGEANIKVKIVLKEALSKDAVVTLEYDEARLEEYKFITGDYFELFPENGVNVENVKFEIPAGKTESETVELTFKAKDLDYGIGYLIPLTGKSDEAAFTTKSKYLDIVVIRENNRSMKNVLYFEVNDTNPLNALELRLEDGSPFLDAVVLFAANINYNSVEDVVFLHNNPNVQALLDESETYLQPLRKAGIKVYLGLLGNHDQSGLCQLSDWGCKQYAQEVAEACREYGLDGVNLDDEYSGRPDTENKWFTQPSAKAGARLCWELKQALKKECYWPTEVSYYQLGNLNTLPPVTIDGTEHKVSEFIDFYVGDYGTSTGPYGGLTYANCSAMSLELNRGSGWITEESVKEWKENGYGYIMWFAYDPAPGSGIYNRDKSLPKLREAAKGMFDQELKNPTGYYKKIDEGKFDPNRYEY